MFHEFLCDNVFHLTIYLYWKVEDTKLSYYDFVLYVCLSVCV